jgi:hypothetical protein
MVAKKNQVLILDRFVGFRTVQEPELAATSPLDGHSLHDMGHLMSFGYNGDVPKRYFMG